MLVMIHRIESFSDRAVALLELDTIHRQSEENGEFTSHAQVVDHYETVLIHQFEGRVREEAEEERRGRKLVRDAIWRECRKVLLRAANER